MLAIILVALWPQSSASCLYKHELAHAGGWGANHPNAIYIAECGHLPMPPRVYKPIGKVNIKYVTFLEMQFRCTPLGLGILLPFARVQACSSIGTPAQIYLPLNAPKKSLDAR